MDVFRVACENCDMKAKSRFGKERAERLATEHAAETGHSVTITNLDDPGEEIVIEG